MSQKSSITSGLIRMVLVGMSAVTALPSVAVAQAVDPTRGTWMAASSNEASLAGRGWGRLTLADGVLAFQSPNDQWRLTLSEIKRIAASKNLSKALEVESASGQIYYIAILDSRMTMTSPGKAAQTIQRAVRVAPAPPTTRPAVVAAGPFESR